MKNSGVEWIGEIPEDWEVKKLKYSFLERKSKNIGMKEKNLLSLSYGKIIKKNIETKDGLIPESFETYNIIQSGDIVFRLTDLQNDKHSLRTGLCTETGIITSAYTTIIPPKYTDCIYMNYLFHSYDICKVFYNLGAGVRQGMKFSDLGLLQILFPPKSIQQHIASYLDKKCSKIEETIQNQQQVIEKLKAYKQFLITEAVTGKIKIQNGKVCGKYESYKDSGVEWIGKIPSGWNLTKIAYITTKIGSGKTPNGGAAIYIDEGVLFIRSQNVYNEGLLLDEPMFISDEIDDDMKSTRLANNDVLLNITGGSIGRCCIYEKKYGRANVNQHVCIIRVIPTKVIPKFMQLFWISKVGEISIDIYQTGGNREGMSGDAISKTLIPLPTMDEQKEIANYLDKKCTAIDTAIEQKQKLIEKLTEYKKSLIYECVTGKKEI